MAMGGNMDKKKEFLKDEFWSMAWNASVQHVVLYNKGAEQNQRKEFSNKVKAYMKSDIIPKYKGTVEESRHCENIRGLIEHAKRVGAGVLGEDRYNYGVAQKLLNLALKYYWCLGLIKEPPHCPVDRKVINKTDLRGKGVKWTRIKTETEYLNIVSAIKSKAEEDKCSIAQWELKVWKSNNY